MQPDIIVDSKYVALNDTNQIFNIPLWSIVTPTRVGKKLVTFQVTEFPSKKEYSFMTGHDKFTHLFKSIRSEWVTNALKRGIRDEVLEFIADDYLGE